MDRHTNLGFIGAALDEHAIVSVTDAAGNITYVNQKFIDIAGYTLPELLGENHRMLKSGIHAPAFYQHMWDTLLSGQTWQGEVCNRRKNGELYWVRASIKPILDNHGLPLQYISIRTDITEVKQAEEAEQRSRRLLRSVIDTIPDLIFFKDKDRVYLGCNRAFEQYLGTPEAQIIGKTDFDFANQESANFREIDKRMLATGKEQTNEEWLTYPDGRKVLVEMLKTPYDYGGEAPGVIGVAHDITEHSRAEEQVRQLAFYDTLTRLPNRRLLNDRMIQAMAINKRSGCHGALMFLDLDNFKPLNDTHGHVMGDLLLVEAADRLRSCIREMDTVARFGGDEFVVILSDLSVDKNESILQASIVAEKIRHTLSQPYSLILKQEGKADKPIEHHCTASIGVVVFNNHEVSQDDILKWADTAMYQAKESGRNLIRFYDFGT